MFNSYDGFTLCDDIGIYQAADDSVSNWDAGYRSEEGVIHIVLGQTVAGQVYGITYQVTDIEDTDGMQVNACSFDTQ